MKKSIFILSSIFSLFMVNFVTTTTQDADHEFGIKGCYPLNSSQLIILLNYGTPFGMPQYAIPPGA